MATFLARALNLQPPEADTTAGFTDVDADNTHSADIAALLTAGITTGCSTQPPRYCPNQPVTRAQMATFLARALNLQPPTQP
ncbi:MAG: S-layer homology domain-containing protein [Acidimicrobiaceae bacterium]|nr:S-layer homology domain-containing protein [Acidimicrobiaceae bacterium]